ncbi:hypothetical protein DKT77_19185 [Meridianimarinicoccus roseus]|uniref:Transposase n=1 Tax=Meridianimarinicoccus roseus TaxID=2072018 RepID=A0A2V2LCR7_9RHOB|nr:hypothetical protein DKT77_19185 [Meridianimarinicoccus roseus]
MAYGWFGRLGLTDAVPDHSTFPKNRQPSSSSAQQSPRTFAKWPSW